MLPEAFLRLHVLVLNVGWRGGHEYILNAVKRLATLALAGFAYELLHLVGSVDALLSLVFAVVHLEKQVGEPQGGAHHHRVQELEHVVTDRTEDRPL